MKRFKSFDPTGTLCVLGCSLVFGAGTTWAQPSIDHGGIRCLPDDRFVVLFATIDPAAEVRTAKLYFRSAIFADYYYVEMAPLEGYFSAALPLPSEDTTRIIYYMEAVDYTFNTSRTLEFEVEVGSGDRCRPGPAGALFQGTDPGIAVGVTRAGMPAIPVGFQAIGIRSLIAATGGGASSLGLAVGAVAGAGAGVGVLVATGDGSTDPVEDGGEEPPGGNGGGGVGQTPGPLPPGPTSTTPGGTPPGPTTTTTTSGSPPPGPTTSTSGTTSAATTTTIILPSLTACFNWTPLGDCRMHFESCSGPAAAIVRYEWRMLGPPVPASPPDAPSFDFDFTGDPRCVGASPFNRPVRLTVFDAGSTSEELQEDVSVVPTPTSRIPDETISMRSRLMVTAEAGEITGMLSVDGRSLGPPVGGIATVHQLPMRPGEQRIVGQVLGRAPPGTLWRFDFPRPVRVVVRQGATLSLTDRTVVFRLEGRSGERIEFGLRLEGGAPRP